MRRTGSWGTEWSFRVGLWALTLGCGLLLAGAQVDGALPGASDEAAATQQAAPPVSQRVARLTFVAGSLKVQRADNTGEDGAVLNMPLHEGTRLLAEEDGRAELEFEDGSLIRLTPGSTVSLDSLAVAGNRAQTRVSLLSGLAYFELRAANEFAYTVEGAGLQIIPVENTSFRVALAGEAPPSVAVLSGTARVESPDHFHVEVRAGESMRTDASDAARYFLDATYAEEAWDWWNEERDQAASDEAARATSARNGLAGAQGYGWSDMDANGTWYDVPGLGLVWQPSAADESFDPYGFGDWVFDSGEYVFVSGYSWGWTPFRCGRWSWTSGFGWGWSGGAECGRWGFGGRHPLTIGSVPGHYRRPEPPPLGGRVHRIVTVRGPDGPRPPVLANGRPILFNGHRLEGLRPIGTPYTPHGGSAAGRALLRDYPLNPAQKPVFGVEAGSSRLPTAAPGWHEGKHPTNAPATAEGRSPAPGVGSSAARVDRPDTQEETRVPAHGSVAPPATSIRTGQRLADPSSAPTGAALGASHSEPVRQPAASPPVILPPRRPEPAPAPVRVTPPPPAPVRVAPPPSPPPAPVRAAPVAPK